MTRVVGIAGSRRTGSFNQALLRAAVEVAPETLQIEVASIAEIPLYDGDFETTNGVPDYVTQLKERIAAADGLLLVTPEYNSSIPGVFKNVFDWLSRPSKDIPRIFGSKPVALMGATPGLGGTRMAQAAWLPVLRTLGTNPWFGKQLYVPGAGQVFDANGALTDEKIRKLLTDYMAAFAGFAAFVEKR